MYLSNFVPALLYSFLVVIRSVRAASTSSVDLATVSITSAAGFLVQPPCVQSCVYYSSFDVADYLVGSLCATTMYDACYCTQSADQTASAILSQCISALCRGTTEVSGAISLYQSYCSVAGYPRSVSAAQTTSTPSSSSSASQSAASTPTSTSMTTSPATTSPSTSNKSSQSSSSSASSSSTSSSASQPSNSGGTTANSESNTGAIAGGVVGGVLGLALIFGIIYVCLRRTRQKPGNDHLGEAGQSSQPSRPIEEKETMSPVSPVPLVSTDVKPVAASKPRPGRAELDSKDGGPTVNVAQTDSTKPPELYGNARHGLRPKELDASGRYVGELHGDGRHATGGVELP